MIDWSKVGGVAAMAIAVIVLLVAGPATATQWRIWQATLAFSLPDAAVADWTAQDEAISQTLRAALDVVPDDFEALHMSAAVNSALSMDYAEQDGQGPAAQVDKGASDAAQVEASDGVAMLPMGQVAQNRADVAHQLALHHFSRALEIRPADPQVWHALAVESLADKADESTGTVLTPMAARALEMSLWLGRSDGTQIRQRVLYCAVFADALSPSLKRLCGQQLDAARNTLSPDRWRAFVRALSPEQKSALDWFAARYDDPPLIRDEPDVQDAPEVALPAAG